MKKRSYSKVFNFKGELYGYGGLVLAIIQEYANRNPRTTVKEIKKVFSDDLQNRFSVVVPVKEVPKIEKKGPKRFYTRPEQLVKVKNGKLAVTKYWGSSNIDEFLNRAKEIGFKVSRVRLA